MITIQNEKLQVGVKEKGAELASIRSVRTGLEYLWEADPKYWGRHSCILFPVIGATQDGVITVQGKQYPMPKHGLVRDMQWELVEQSEMSMTFACLSNGDTLTSFPWAFELRAIYTVEDGFCHIDYEVYNESDELMPFSIGGHPAFNCPIYADQERSDYKLVFDQLETQQSPLLSADGLIQAGGKPILVQEQEILITNNLFDADALILSDFNSCKATFVGPGDHRPLSVHFADFTHLGIWSKSADSPFVCIEPWYGVADPEGYIGEFMDKPGVVTIEPDEVFSCRHSVEVH